MRHRRTWQSTTLRGIALALALLPCGCVSSGKHSAIAEAPVPRDPVNAQDVYTLACPDVVEVDFEDWPELNRVATIGPDGCVDLGELGRIHIDGDTIHEAAQRIAARARMPFARVLVRVAEHHSRQLYLFAPAGNARAVPYHGPETVLEVLQRAGGLSAESTPREIYLVRSQVAESKPAEVLTVDLDAIRTRGDHRTDYRVQPQDEIYVGAKPGSTLAKAVPPILKPAYEMVRSLFTTKK